MFSKGEFVTLTFGDRQTIAEVALSSDSGASLFLTFDAIIGGFAGGMAVLQDEDGRYRSLLGGQLVRIQRFVEDSIDS